MEMEDEVELPPVFEFIHNIAKKHNSIVNYEREIKHLRYMLDCCEKKCLILERKLKSKKCAKCGHERPNRTTRGTTTRDLTRSIDVGVQFPDLFPELLAYNKQLKFLRPVTPITDPAELMLISKNAKTCTKLRGVTRSIGFIDGFNRNNESTQTDPIQINDDGLYSIIKSAYNSMNCYITNYNKDPSQCLQKEIKDEDSTSSNEANVGLMPEKKKWSFKKSKQTMKNELKVSSQDKSVGVSYIDLRTLDNHKYKNEVEKPDDHMIIESGLSIEEVNSRDDHVVANDGYENINSNILEKCDNMDTGNQVESEEDSVQGHGNRESSSISEEISNATSDNIIRDECTINTMKIIDNSLEEVQNPIFNIEYR
ncbi:uncharacterized protein LOC119686452 [Teleopsis dalmanni]|uniref:uncharacterized protein LOC119686452 n=1 Tax=Teleopsis dalmanni TaxID=139649 RepID=UPI0018CD5642|nr:uncharacterized protein LOC119686452 [Teleopsis dalmanni]XP_037956964.1 uncharacterized protein LOC119686452 [Teleopsis dalmanni]